MNAHSSTCPTQYPIELILWYILLCRAMLYKHQRACCTREAIVVFYNRDQLFFYFIPSFILLSLPSTTTRIISSWALQQQSDPYYSHSDHSFLIISFALSHRHEPNHSRHQFTYYAWQSTLSNECNGSISNSQTWWCILSCWATSISRVSR